MENKIKNKFFGIAILFLLLINLSFILAQENQEIVLGENTINFDSEKVDYKVVSLDGEEIIQLDFTQGGFAEIKGVRFENILPASESLNPSYMKLDTFGNILEADLTANEKGSIFLINGLTFKAPPNSRVYYDEASFFHLKDVSITNIEKDKLSSLDNFLIFGERINFFNELLVDSGRVYIKDRGYIISDGNFVYKNVEINQGVNSLLIEKNPLRDLSGYADNFIQETESGLKIQTVSDALGFNLRFLENNELFDVKNTEDKEAFLDIEISDGDKLEIVKKDYLIKGLPPLIKHESHEGGRTSIQNGRHIFKFEEGKFNSELGNLNTKNKLSIISGIESDVIENKIINIDDDNGYSISELGKGNIFSFNKALLSPPNYNFESEVGKKVYSFAEEQIGNSAFVEEGRGKCYGEEQKVKGFDCIGLAISSLKKVYPDSSLKDFPPNLKLVNELEKKGWSSSIIEPASVQNNVKTTEAVKNIPAGSIVFLMHDYQSYSPEEIGGVIEGIDYQNYLNSKQEETFLVLGHTLIKGTGKKNFINAYPNVGDVDLPLRARKINENLKKQGKPPIFIGTVREGEMVPQEDYLLVISPPKT